MYTVFVLLFVLFGESSTRNGAYKQGVHYYTNTWLVNVTDRDAIQMIAREENFEILEELNDFPGLFLFRHKQHPKKAKYENIYLTEKLYQYKEVSWNQHIPVTSSRVRKCRCPQTIKSPVCPTTAPVNDELYEEMYYVHDCRPLYSKEPVADININPVWQEMRIFGQGIIVMVIDEGVDFTHPDLYSTFLPILSTDLVDDKKTPEPEYLFSWQFNHGTNCAGIIAAKGDNKICNVGIAPLVRWAAIRLHGTSKTPLDKEGKALAYGVAYIDVSSNSWGPEDTGHIMEYLGIFRRSAFKIGITKGRRGKGTIFVFPAGNGKGTGDMCGYDCTANTIYTITVAGTDENGKTTAYSERCSGIMVTAYSHEMATTDNGGDCKKNFSGTSAAVPVVSGVIALIIEANRNLLWRDVQHILVWTSNPSPLQNNHGWNRNAAGFWVSHDFGFGLINAGEAVKLAKQFVNVPPMSICVVPFKFKIGTDLKFSRISPITITIRTKACQGLPSEIRYIEHIQLQVNIKHPRRGDLRIDLQSPQGNISHLIEPRPKDGYPEGLLDWSIDTVHFWGESPRGHWRVHVLSEVGHSSREGEVKELTLVIYGTKDVPEHYKTTRPYYEFHPSQ